jgi:hypothetical protein
MRTMPVRLAATYVLILKGRAKRARLSLPQYTARLARQILAKRRGQLSLTTVPVQGHTRRVTR